MLLFIFFFFKQKTAYEMRISDWSSDVCSSDLRKSSIKERKARQDHHEDEDGGNHHPRSITLVRHRRCGCSVLSPCRHGGERRNAERPYPAQDFLGNCHHRSEEHTSELQSLMRISYAVFCLKKKNNYHDAHIDKET